MLTLSLSLSRFLGGATLLAVLRVEECANVSVSLSREQSELVRAWSRVAEEVDVEHPAISIHRSSISSPIQTGVRTESVPV